MPSTVFISKASGAEQTSETNKKMDDKFKKVKNFNWLEANQLAIYKHSQGFELVLDHREQTQLKVRAGLGLGAYGLQVQRSYPSAMLR